MAPYWNLSRSLVLLVVLVEMAVFRSTAQERLRQDKENIDIADEEEAVDPYLLPYTIPDFMELPKVDATRKERFPDKEYRVKVYMSNWYLPPCSEKGKVLYQYDSLPKSLWLREPRNLGALNSTEYVVYSSIEPDTAFFLNRAILYKCVQAPEKSKKYNTNMVIAYCPDAASTLLTALDHVLWEMNPLADKTEPPPAHTLPPILLQFGDLRYSHYTYHMNTPLIKKFRSSTSPSELERLTKPANMGASCVNVRDKMITAHNQPSLEPVVWKLGTSRHFGYLGRVLQEDIPWNEKSDKAIFRGQLTGSRDGYERGALPLENCLSMRRCRLVFDHAESSLVDALLTSTRGRLPDSIDNVTLVSRKVDLSYLLTFKGIVMLEGNDVASGLKWALLSQSVVLMPVPKHTSWAMEELLEPWVHYVPLNADASDVEEKMQWVLDHDEHAQRIAQRGSLWIQDLVFHPEAMEDDRDIQEEILRRYMSHFKLEKGRRSSAIDQSVFDVMLQ